MKSALFLCLRKIFIGQQYFKIGKEDMATLVYIEGQLSEEELMNILYKR